MKNDDTEIKPEQPVMQTRSLTGNDLPKPKEYDTEKYKQLPPPIVEHLEKTFGNWLEYFEIGQEWKEDFGGYGLYIKVPREFSTEWREEMVQKFDNKRRAPMLDEKGNTVRVKTVKKDIRWRSMAVGVPEVNKWVEQVKRNIIDKAYSKGLVLPTTGVEMGGYRPSREEFTKSLHTAPQ